MNTRTNLSLHPFVAAASLAAAVLHGVYAQEVISIPKKVFGTGPANTAAYSPDSKLIVTGNEAGAHLASAISKRNFTAPRPLFAVPRAGSCSNEPPGPQEGQL